MQVRRFDKYANVLVIRENKRTIKELTAENTQIEKDYASSAVKEQEVKSAFHRLKESMQVQEQGQIMQRFSEIFRKNKYMHKYVEKL